MSRDLAAGIPGSSLFSSSFLLLLFFFFSSLLDGFVLGLWDSTWCSPVKEQWFFSSLLVFISFGNVWF